jgi:hypothetical protein
LGRGKKNEKKFIVFFAEAQLTRGIYPGGVSLTDALHSPIRPNRFCLDGFQLLGELKYKLLRILLAFEGFYKGGFVARYLPVIRILIPRCYFSTKYEANGFTTCPRNDDLGPVRRNPGSGSAPRPANALAHEAFIETALENALSWLINHFRKAISEAFSSPRVSDRDPSLGLEIRSMAVNTGSPMSARLLALSSTG